MTNYKVLVGGLTLLYSLNVTLCIPLHEFYPFGGDAPEAVHKLADGREKFSRPVYIAEAVRFYGEPQHTIFVSSYIVIASYVALIAS